MQERAPAPCDTLMDADALFVRASHAIEESRAVREQHRRVTGRYEEAVKDLRLAIMDSAMLRLEIKAHRDNEEP